MNAETKANHYLTCDIVYSRYSQGHNNPKDYKKWVSGIASDKLANLLCNDSRRIKIVVFVAKNRCDWRASDCLLHNLNKSISFFFCSLYTERDMIYMSHWASTFSTISRINCNTRFCPSLIGCFLPLLTCCNSEWISGMWDVLQFLMSLCRSYSWHFTQSVQHATVKWSNCVFCVTLVTTGRQWISSWATSDLISAALFDAPSSYSAVSWFPWQLLGSASGHLVTRTLWKPRVIPWRNLIF